MVINKFFLVITISIYCTTSAFAQFSVQWDPPTTNEDNSTLTDLESYTLKYKKNNGAFIIISDITESQYEFSNLTAGLYTIQVHAVDTSGNESQSSNQVIKIIEADIPDDGGDDGDDGDDDGELGNLKFLDFDGDGISEWGMYAISGRGRNTELLHNFAYVEDSDEELQSFGARNSQPVYADYDGDSITDIAYVVKKGKKKNSLLWNIEQSSDLEEVSFRFGKVRDTIITNCYFDADKKADPVVITKNKALIRLSTTTTNKRVRLPRMTTYDSICADLNGDGIDELVFLSKARSRLKLKARSAYLVKAINLNGAVVLNKAVGAIVSRTIVAVDRNNTGTQQILYFKKASRNKRLLNPVLLDLAENITTIDLDLPRFNSITQARFVTNSSEEANGLLFLSRNRKNFINFNFEDLELNTEAVEEYLSGSDGVNARRWKMMHSQVKYGQ